MLRITEHNDWVVCCLLGSVFAYIAVLSVFNRDAGVREFLLQKAEDTSNLAVSWIVISTVRRVLLAVLLSQFIPVVPRFVSKIDVFGLTLNKFGFTFLSIAIFDLVRYFLSFLFYSAIGNEKILKGLMLVAGKFYFLESSALIIASFVLYFYPMDLVQYFYGVAAGLIILFVTKNILYIFHNQPILPEKWYYKFLYICTLQIVPMLVLWKFLFY